MVTAMMKPTADCNYDGGDCCGTCVITNHCVKCECLGEVTATNPLIGNGICNDETNNEGCDYDFGECCLSSPNTDHCSDCECSTTGVITSPGYPGKYAHYLYVSWITQVPSGQLIEITFITLDVEHDREDHSSCG